MRKSLDPSVHKVVLSMDSSDHRQYGVKSEGVDFGYQKFPCLNSQNLFDDKGICYGFKLRKGNTHSAAGTPEMLYQSLKVIPSNVKKYFREDSAYSSSEIYNICLNQNCNFVICLKENVWSSVLAKNRRHIRWQKTRLQFFDSDKCEIGSCLYLYLRYCICVPVFAYQQTCGSVFVYLRTSRLAVERCSYHKSAGTEIPK